MQGGHESCQQSDGKLPLPGPKSQDRLVCSCGNVERIYIRQGQHSSVVASQRCGRAFPTHWRYQPSISRRSSRSRLRNLLAPPGAWRNLSSWPGRGFYRDGRSRVRQENRSGRGIGCECRPREHMLIPKKNARRSRSIRATTNSIAKFIRASVLTDAPRHWPISLIPVCPKSAASSRECWSPRESANSLPPCKRRDRPNDTRTGKTLVFGHLQEVRKVSRVRRIPY